MDKLNITESIIKKSISDLVLDRLDALVYICNLDNYEILYMNDSAKQLYGDGLGKKCWQWFQQEGEKPCPYCSINYLKKYSNEDHIYIQDQFNPKNDSWYEVHDKLIEWPATNQRVKLQIAYNIDHRKQDEKKLMVFYRQQELFSKIATSFNKQEAFAGKVNEVLSLVGTFVEVSRVSVYENIPEKKHASLTYEWCKTGISPKINYIQELVFDSSDQFNNIISNNQLINANDLNDPQYKHLFSIFRKFNVRAMLFLPLYLHERHTGFVSFEVCDEIRVWQKDEIQLLKTFGNIISTSFERKNLEENRIRFERNLKKANATKDKFFSIITRDLLSPFSALTSLSSMLLENYSKWPDDKRLLFIESLREASKQGYKLLDNLITWSKMQSGKMEFYPKEVDIRSAINLAVEQLKEKADKKNIMILGIPEDFTFVYADYMMLHTIMKNLLSNAIKFTPENGLITIGLQKNDDLLEVGVSDNGIGIEKAYVKTMFKIDKINSDFGPTEGKGTGLGLIICREFVEKNGGKIWVESEFGIGSSFKFTVPLCK